MNARPSLALSLLGPLWALLFAVFALAGAARADEAPAVKHRIMVCEYSNAAHRLAEIDSDGRLAWEYKVPSVAVCFRLAPERRIVFADGGHPTGVIEVDREQRTVFDYRAACEQVMCCERLPSGNILLAEQGPCRAVEVSPKGEVVSSVDLATTEKGAHLQMRCLHRLPDGHLLACHEGEAVVREYDAAGKPVWEYPGVAGTFEALRLPSGNTLIGGGTGKRLFEVNPAKETVWELTAADVPDLNLTWVTSLEVLKNGNIMVANFLRGQEGHGAHAFEVTHDAAKKVVWKYAAHDVVQSITMVAVMDEPPAE